MSKQKSSSRFGNEDGSVLIICALTLSALLAFAAFAIDIGFAYMRIAQLQSVADAEALACARDYQNCTGVANEFPLTNPYGFAVTLQKGVTCPNTITQVNCVQSNATTTVNTFFLPLFGISQLNLGKSAISGKRITGDALIIRGLVSINGTNILTVSTGSVDIGAGISTTNQSGIDATQSGASITVFNNSTNSCGSCTPAVVSTSSPLPTLPAYSPPTPPSASTYTPGCSLPSGTYNTAVNLSNCGSQVNMSGVYYFNGGFDNKGVTLAKSPGAGVTIIVGVDQPFNLSGTVNLNSSNGASTCGTVGGGMVVYQPVTLTNKYYSIDVAGSGNNINLTGKVQLPNTDFTFRGSPTSFIVTGTLYANSLTLKGNMTAAVSPDPCQNINLSAGNTILVQ